MTDPRGQRDTGPRAGLDPRVHALIDARAHAADDDARRVFADDPRLYREFVEASRALDRLAEPIPTPDLTDRILDEVHARRAFVSRPARRRVSAMRVGAMGGVAASIAAVVFLSSPWLGSSRSVGGRDPRADVLRASPGVGPRGGSQAGSQFGPHVRVPRVVDPDAALASTSGRAPSPEPAAMPRLSLHAADKYDRSIPDPARVPADAVGMAGAPAIASSSAPRTEGARAARADAYARFLRWLMLPGRDADDPIWAASAPRQPAPDSKRREPHPGDAPNE